MGKPKISVIMSVYNQEKYLAQALESILSQTFTDFEFLIINDDSKDNSLKTLKEFEKKDKRIKIIDNKKNLGLTKSLNKGLKMAKGKYVARLDADDFSEPERLKFQYEFMEEHPEIGAMNVGFKIIDEEGKIISDHESVNLSPEAIYYTLIFYNCLAPHSGLIFRKNIALNLGGYNEAFKMSQDADFLYRLSRVAKIWASKKILIKWRDTKTNISTLHKLQQDKFGKKIFIKNIRDLMGKGVDLNRLWCFHDEGFAERQPVNVPRDSLTELRKIQEKMIETCPWWLSKKILKKYMETKMKSYKKPKWLIRI